jgi:ribonuclease BN (tRNA processing enzyme)
LINADERKKLQDKPITVAIHKELQEIYDKLKESTDAEDKIIEQRFEQQKHDYEDKLVKVTKEATEEGLKKGREEKASEGTEKVNTLLKFLRLAGYRRTFTSDNPQEDEAIEQVLVLVYSGDSSAMEACMKLAEGSSELVVEDHSVSCEIPPKHPPLCY